MNKVFVFGDCHTARIWEHHDPNDCPFSLRMWGKGGTKIFGIDFENLTLENALSSGMESGRENLSFDPEVGFQEYKNSDWVFLWLGYIDIRQFLPKYNNADELANMYINKITSFFKDKKIGLIEPLPQFTEMLLKYEGISPSYEYSDRLNQNFIFLNSLRKYAKENNIPIIVSQEEIYQAVGRNEFTTDMTHNKAPHPVDGLQDEYNLYIYNLFVKNISKFIN